ncbi:MAG: hypothetical protein MMC33_000206 [Icmadophila ericetorum]|nr:hypothetical protein [Icmadophila ericetorum]
MSTTTPLTSTLPNPRSQFLIRPLHFSDISALAALAQAAFEPLPLTSYLHPHIHDSPASEARNLRWLRHSFRRRVLDPKYESFAAVVASSQHGKGEEEVVGLTQFYRTGDADRKNGGVRRQVEARERPWSVIGLYLKARRLMWEVWMRVNEWIWPNLGMDQETEKTFVKAVVADEKEFWEANERYKERWHVQSVVVGVEWQRQGVGKLLMQEVLERAKKEGVCVGVEASKEGEGLYRKCGFGLLGRFELIVPGAEPDDGGVMVWEPWSQEEEEEQQRDA